MKERIVGIETEFGLELLDEEGRAFSSSDTKSLKKEIIITQLGIRGRDRKNFQPNGSRIYRDVGDHIEYATPECRSARNLVIYDKAGERMIHKIVLKGREQRGIKEKLIVFKNNTDLTKEIGVGSSWGCHENYLIPDVYFKDDNLETGYRWKVFFHLLTPFLITRQIYSGGGWFFLKDNTGNKKVDSRPFPVLSQRAPFVNSVYNEAPINQRRQKQMLKVKLAFTNEGGFRRLEVRVGESNLAEWSTYLKVGTAAIVLRMIEDGFLEKHLPLDYYNLMYPIAALSEVTKDITCKKPIVYINKQFVSALEIQRDLYFEPAKVYLNRCGASEEENDLMEKWRYILDAIDDNPLKLSDRLDVWIRLKLFLDYMRKYKISWDHWRVGALNLAYDNIDKEKSVFYRLQEKGKIKRIVTDKEIKSAEINPPSDTRARPRGLMVKLAKKNNWIYYVDWDEFTRVVKDSSSALFPGIEKKLTLQWQDPFQAQDERVARLIKEYRKRFYKRIWEKILSLIKHIGG